MMAKVLKLLFTGPAVTPENVCILWDVLGPTVILDRAVRLQLSVFILGEPGGSFIALDKEKFRFSCQIRARGRHKDLPDGVQVDSLAVQVSAKQLG